MGSSFLVFLQGYVLPHTYFCFRICNPIVCTCKEFFNTYISWLLPISQSKHFNIMMTSIICRSVLVRPSAKLGIGQWLEHCNLTMLNLKFCQIEHQAKVISMLVCLSPSSLSRAFACHSVACICYYM